MTPETQWLLAWFEQQGTIPGETLEEKLNVNYFAAELIDSFGSIMLIGEIEEHFGISFDEKHFQDRRFATIGGLSEFIAQLRQADEA